MAFSERLAWRVRIRFLRTLWVSSAFWTGPVLAACMGSVSNHEYVIRGTPQDDTIFFKEQAPTLGPWRGERRFYINGCEVDGPHISLVNVVVFHGFAGNDTFTMDSGMDLRAYGGAGDDQIAGGHGYDYIEGGDGNDILKGLEGRDALKGGEGNDTLYGGDELDVLFGGSGADSLLSATVINSTKYCHNLVFRNFMTERLAGYL